MDSLEKRHRIHQDNIDLHLGLFDRITEMQAMELKKVTQGQIEEIAVDYEEKLEKHRDILNAARAAQGLDSQLDDSAERKELAALERQILAEAGTGELKPAEAKAEPRRIEKPVAQRPKLKALEGVDEELEALERELMAERAAAQAQKAGAAAPAGAARAEPAKTEAAATAASGAAPSDQSVARRKSIEEELAALDAEDDEAERSDDDPELEE